MTLKGHINTETNLERFSSLYGRLGSCCRCYFSSLATRDLLPVSRTTVKFAESITMENDGHEDESI